MFDWHRGACVCVCSNVIMKDKFYFFYHRQYELLVKHLQYYKSYHYVATTDAA